MKEVIKQFIITSVLMLVMSLAFFILYIRADVEIDRANTSYRNTLALAAELRFTSEDLTKMVRAFVVTKDNKYKDRFNEIIAIRNGDSPRPENLDKVYWDLVLDTDERPSSYVAPISIFELMKNTGFTDAEFALLEQAKRNSDNLTRIEFEAMSLVEVSELPSDHQNAIAILFDDEYMQAKANIMRPIRDIEIAVEKRIQEQLERLALYKQIYLISYIFFLVIAFVFLWRIIRAHRQESYQLVKRVQLRTEELRESNTLLKNSQSLMKMGSWQYDIDSATLTWNKELFEIYEYEKSETPAIDEYLCMVHPNDRDFVFNLIKGSLKTKNLSGQFRIITPSGEIKHIQNVGDVINPLSSDKGMKLLGVSQDVTAYIREKERLKAIIDSANIGYWDWHIPTDSVVFDSHWLTMLGYSPDKISGSNETWRTLVHPDDMQVCYEEMRQFLKGDIKNYRNIHRLLHKDGTWRYILDRGMIIERDEQGKPIRAAGTHTDVTDEIRDKDFLRSILEYASDGIHILDRDGYVVECSHAFAESLGYSYEQTLKLHVSDWAIDAHKDGLNSVDQDLIDTPRSFETKHRRKDGTEVDVEVSTARLKFYESEYLYVSSRDISIRKEQEMLLNEAKETADKVTKAKTEFFTNMNHEIRTPLNGIIGMVDIVLDSDLSDSQRHTIDVVKRSGESLLTIINDILDFSKIDAGKLNIESIEFVLDDLISDISLITALRLEDKNIKLLFDTSEVRHESYIGDPTRVRQILLNLLSNALKFTKQGEISLHINKQVHGDGTEWLKFSVKDTGIGIPEHKLHDIFERFSQADSSTTRNYGGTGLGLAICKQLIQLMGGSITVESEVEKGSTFWFELKLQRVEKKDSLGVKFESSTTLVNKTFNARVLIVEDNKTNQLVARGYLKKMGIKTTVAENGKEALEKLETNHFDLIFMDCQMPVMDGFEATKLIRQSGNMISIVAMTANTMTGDKQLCLDAGMDDHLAKPLNKEKLIIALSEWLPDSISSHPAD